MKKMNDLVRDKFMKKDGRIDLQYEVLAGACVSPLGYCCLECLPA